MKFSQESKSQLAKLMATENVVVQHGKVSTASFDLKNRVLTVPIWKDMSGDLYDLLLGHEVGHALETPMEGWHNAVTGTGKFDRNFKHFLNVVEDARIEKKIKRRYPGLKQSFIRGYESLLRKDFFGIGTTDINTLPFIDRLNIHTKSSAITKIDFTDEELGMVREVESCETWDDVLEVTKAIFDYSKEEQKEIANQLLSSAMPNFGDEDYDDFDSMDENDESDEYEDGDYGSDFSDEESDGESDEETKSTFERQLSEEKYSSPIFGADNFSPVCRTDEQFRKNETALLSEENFEYVYVNIPEPNYKDILTDYKTVHKRMSDFWNITNSEYNKTLREDLYSDFRKRNERYISLLAKEFEMRKSASKFSKQKVSDTGDIDVSKIFKYKIDDNIFRKMTKIPKGKSHGLVMIFDRSGSMKNNMSGTIEQMLVLSLFCKKVNIPFVVYGFGNEISGFNTDRNANDDIHSFKKSDGSIYLREVFLREYLNNRMSTSEFSSCVKNLVLLANTYSKERKTFIPMSEPLSNTPMIEAIVALRDITVNFKKNNNLDIVKTIILHDGDADLIGHYYKNERYERLDKRNTNLYLTDVKKKLQYKVHSYEHDYGLRESIMKWYKDTTDSDIIGFYITGKTMYEMRGAIEQNYHFEDGKGLRDIMEDGKNYFEMRDKTVELAKKMREEKYLESNNRGYSKFFMVLGGSSLQIDNEEMELGETFTHSKLKNAFLKMNMKRQINRVLVNRFIKEIAV